MKTDTARAADIPELCALLALLFEQEAEFKPDLASQERGLAMIIGNPELGRILVLREHGRIAAMANLLFTVSTALGARVAILEDVVVRTDCRGRGLGHAMLDAVCAFAKEHSIARITLLTDADNARAQALYKAHGFEKSGMSVMRAFP
ncbi:MAG TPA: GNAT family N-acetyltransferase [Opitutales bacterium]|nr:GNAT family N-acetyltransferase [Opitutales bacterium]